MKIDKVSFNNADAILFDLGGVILNIDYHKTSNEFKKIGITNFDELYSQVQQSGLFDDLETGKISGEFFISKIISLSKNNITKQQVVDSWNAMLLDLPSKNLLFLDKINKLKRCFLFSNTNEIHLNCFNDLLFKQHGLKSIDSFFEKCYYSHIFSYRKPNHDGFIEICRLNNINLEKLIFIDDSIQHIESAKELGINAFLFGKEDDLENFIDLV